MNAIIGSNGIILNVANKLNCDWHTAKSYIEKWDDTIKALEDENEVGLDFTESKMFDRISDGSDAMIKFHLDRKGKQRGYGEKSLLDIGDLDIKVTIEKD